MVSVRARASSFAKSFLPDRSIIVDHANWTRIPLYLFNENLCWQTDEKKSIYRLVYPNFHYKSNTLRLKNMAWIIRLVVKSNISQSNRSFYRGTKARYSFRLRLANFLINASKWYSNEPLAIKLAITRMYSQRQIECFDQIYDTLSIPFEPRRIE